MPTHETREPIVFSTEDSLVTFVFTIGKDASRPPQDLFITVAIELFWEGASPPEPLAAEIRMRQPAQIAHVSDNGYTLNARLDLQSMSNGRIAIVAEVDYGDRDDDDHHHHLAGVLGTFSPAAI